MAKTINLTWMSAVITSHMSLNKPQHSSKWNYRKNRPLAIYVLHIRMTRPALGTSRAFCMLYPISNDPTDAVCCHTSAILRYYDERSSVVKSLKCRTKQTVYTLYSSCSGTVYIQNWPVWKQRYEPELLRGEESCVIVQPVGTLLDFLCSSYWTCMVRMYLLKNTSMFCKWMQETECDNKQTNERTNEQTNVSFINSKITVPEVSLFTSSFLRRLREVVKSVY